MQCTPCRYTGPLFEKYNGVLRFFSSRVDGEVRLQYESEEMAPYLQKKCGWLGLGEWKPVETGGIRWAWFNTYETTIHVSAKSEC